MRKLSIIFVLAALSMASATVAVAQMAPDNLGKAASGLPPVLRNVGFEPPLNGQLPLDTVFRDETGREVHLGDYFHQQKPVLLAPVYFGCPMLCNEVENGVVGALRMLSFKPGRDYEVIFLSFDPRETPDMAAQKKKAELAHFNQPGTDNGWHFLVGPKDSVDAVTKAANFRYVFDEKSNLFAHASGILLLTPDGRISRYFYGVEYPARDLRLGLVDASSGKIGTPADHLLLFCFQYDPSTAKYSASILRILRLAGLLTMLGIVAGILIFRRREHSNGSRSSAGGQGAH